MEAKCRLVRIRRKFILELFEVVDTVTSSRQLLLCGSQNRFRKLPDVGWN